MHKFFIILSLFAVLSTARHAYAEPIIPEKLDKKITENYEIINKLTEQAFDNIPVMSEIYKKTAIDPKLYIVKDFYKNIESGNLEYLKEYDFGANNEKITLYETNYIRTAPKEILKYSKEGKLLSYDILSTKELPSVKYSFLPESWNLSSVNIMANETKTYSFDPAGKYLKEPDFGPYMKNLQKKIKNAWHPPIDHHCRKVTVLFKLDRNGKLLKLNIKNSSGDTETDNYALNAVRKNAPFEPLPADYKGDDIDIQFTFEYNVYNQLPY